MDVNREFNFQRDMTQFSSGARSLIRDQEWRIHLVDLSTDGGWLLACGGISDLVRGQIALEDDIGIVGSAETLLVPYDRPNYHATMLNLKSQCWRAVGGR